MMEQSTSLETGTTALVVFSGGQDSTFCLFWALHRFDAVHTVTFNYGQRHEREISAAANIIKLAQMVYPGKTITSEVVNVGPILAGTSPLTNPNEELEQYADHASLPGGLEKTFVPMRNQLFLTLAANRAYVIGSTNLVTGVCEEDFGGYPDCREIFIKALETAINEGTFTGEDGAPGPLTIHTPLMHMSKAQMVTAGAREEADPIYLAWALSHTSYDGQYPPIGHDHATLLRAKGFEQAGWPDPLVLRAVEAGLMELPETSNYGREYSGVLTDRMKMRFGEYGMLAEWDAQ